MWTVVTQCVRSYTAILCEIRVELLEFCRESQVNVSHDQWQPVPRKSGNVGMSALGSLIHLSHICQIAAFDQCLFGACIDSAPNSCSILTCRAIREVDSWLQNFYEIHNINIHAKASCA